MLGFTRLFQKFDRKSITLTDPAAFGLFGILPSATGAIVTAESAMRVPAVACAVALISETVGTLPAKLFQRADKAQADDHPAYRLMHDQANAWTSAEELRTALTADALLRGHGFALVVRLGDGTPAELHRLDPGRVQMRNEPDGEPFYLVTTDQGRRRYSFTDILHVAAFGGISPVTLGREAIALAVEFESYVARLFANGARPSGIITSPKIMDVTAKQKLMASWFGAHGHNQGGTAVLDEGMQYQALSATLADSQFAENRLEQVREISRVFRVPPTMLFELTRGTWSNTEEMARQFLAVTLKPWLSAWTWAYARVLLTPEERCDHYVEFVTDDFLTTNHAARATAYGQYRSMGVMTANEVRAGLNLPPLPGGEALNNPYITTSDESDQSDLSDRSEKDDAA